MSDTTDSLNKMNDSIRKMDETARQMDDVMQQMIREYRETLKKEKPELDMELLFRIMRLMNDASEVHVAIDPLTDEGEWAKDAPSYGVSGVTVLDDGRVALRVSNEKHGISIEKLESKLRKEFKHRSPVGAPVLYVHGETVTQLTEAYSHALVRDKWAGLPFDLILAIKTEKKAEKTSE